MYRFFAVLLILLSSPAWAGPKATGGMGNPLAPLAEMLPTMDALSAAIVADGDLEGAAAPFDLRFESIKARERILGELKKAGAHHGTYIGQEFELVLQGPERQYYLRSFMHPSTDGAWLIDLSGRFQDSMGVSALPLAKFNGSFEYFADAARSFVRHLVSPRCAQMPVVTDAQLRELNLGPLQEDAAREIPKTRKKVDGICRDVASMKEVKVSLRIDDGGFFFYNSSNELVAMVEIELETTGPGRMMLTIADIELPPNEEDILEGQ